MTDVRSAGDVAVEGGHEDSGGIAGSPAGVLWRRAFLYVAWCPLSCWLSFTRSFINATSGQLSSFLLRGKM